MSFSTESTGRVSREGASVAADGGPGSGGFGEDFRGGTGPHSARHKAPTRVLVGPVQLESQSSQVPGKSLAYCVPLLMLLHYIDTILNCEHDMYSPKSILKHCSTELFSIKLCKLLLECCCYINVATKKTSGFKSLKFDKPDLKFIAAQSFMSGKNWMEGREFRGMLFNSLFLWL